MLHICCIKLSKCYIEAFAFGLMVLASGPWPHGPTLQAGCLMYVQMYIWTKYPLHSIGHHPFEAAAHK